MTSTFCPASASATARLVDVSVLPVPPFGPSTQISRPSVRSPGARCPLRGARAMALLIANRSCSFDCGKSAMSAAPDSNARRRNPFGDDVERTMIGTSGDVRCALSMICSERSSSRPWQATRITSTSRLSSVRTVSSTPSVTPTSSNAGVVGQGPLDVEDVQPLDGYECADGAFHRVPTSAR